MTFLDRYNNESNQELVAIVENPNNYVEECLAVVHQILKERDINFAELKEIAQKIHIERAQKILLTFNPLNDKLEMPFSNYLSEEEMKELYRKQIEWLQERDDAFDINVWHYVMGG